MDKDLILRGRSCLVNFKEDGPETIQEAEEDDYRCGLWESCTAQKNWRCIGKLAVDVAREVIENQRDLNEVMNDGFKEFMFSLPPEQRFVEFRLDEGIFFYKREEAVQRVEEEAKRILSRIEK